METITNANLNFAGELKNFVHNNLFMLTYSGNLSQTVTKSILSLTEKKLEDEKTELSIKKKVFNIMVECMQSICKQEKEKKRDALFMVGRNNNGYVITSGNTIRISEVQELKKYLDLINSKNKKVLKKMYSETLTNIKISAIGTVGLSLIDIAKKSGNKLEYEFTPIDNEYCFFSLQSFVTQKN